MITIAILDDVKSNTEEIHDITESFFNSQSLECQIFDYSDPNTLLAEISTKNISIYLIDIELKKLTTTGIEAAKKINAISPEAQIIFISAYDKYYLDVYQADHIFLVPKTMLKTILPEALDKAMRHLNENNIHIIQFSYNKTSYQIQENRIRYMEKMLRKIKVVANESYQCYGKFDDLISQSSTGNLIQCHKSYVVNTQYIQQLNHTNCVLLDGTVIPVSRRYYPELLKYLSGGGAYE